MLVIVLACSDFVTKFLLCRNPQVDPTKFCGQSATKAPGPLERRILCSDNVMAALRRLRREPTVNIQTATYSYGSFTVGVSGGVMIGNP